MQPIVIGQSGIHNYNVRFANPCQTQYLATIRSFSHDFHGGRFFQQGPESSPNQEVVVG